MVLLGFGLLFFSKESVPSGVRGSEGLVFEVEILWRRSACGFVGVGAGLMRISVEESRTDCRERTSGIVRFFLLFGRGGSVLFGRWILDDVGRRGEVRALWGSGLFGK